ncbi:MAG TPA: class I SAM-dependent methyltransferase [Salinimicrobium sp.]|nr:class I SAM-dependent methyltransferase [Salinimicrobium sp.]
MKNPKPNNTNHSILKLRDFSVSGEEFELRTHDQYDMLVTFPQPEMNRISGYYKSENYISHTDSKKTWFEKSYQWVKSLMLKKKLGWIESEKPDKGHLLDIGAGTGDFLLAAKKRGWKVKGVEPNNEAKLLAKKKGIEFFPDSKCFPDHSFDVITLWHVLEHVPNLEDQIIELKRLLKSNGLLIIAVPNFKSYDAEHYKQFWAAYDVPRHFWHFSETSIRRIFSEYDLIVRKTLPLVFDAYYVSLLSEKYKTGRKNIFSALKIAFVSNFKAKRNNEYSSKVYFLSASSKTSF